jgi:hypothetical protein
MGGLQTDRKIVRQNPRGSIPCAAVEYPCNFSDIFRIEMYSKWTMSKVKIRKKTVLIFWFGVLPLHNAL